MSAATWLNIVRREPRGRRKTPTFEVYGANQARLGEIRWYAPWRRFCYYPIIGTLYDAHCLTALAERCASETKAHREAAA
jgi:hypothetical protein